MQWIYIFDNYIVINFHKKDLVLANLLNKNQFFAQAFYTRFGNKKICSSSDSKCKTDNDTCTDTKEWQAKRCNI